jgi:hypothetical protein
MLAAGGWDTRQPRVNSYAQTTAEPSCGTAKAGVQRAQPFAGGTGGVPLSQIRLLGGWVGTLESKTHVKNEPITTATQHKRN